MKSTDHNAVLQVLPSFDVFKTTGGLYKKDTYTFTVATQYDGFVVLSFKDIVQNPKISSLRIELVTGTPTPTVTPVVTQTPAPTLSSVTGFQISGKITSRQLLKHTSCQLYQSRAKTVEIKEKIPHLT